MRLNQKVLGLMSCVCFSVAIADVPNAAQNALPKTLSLPGQPVYQLKTIECPSPEALVKDGKTMHWSALGLWYSSDRSLATKATAFIGAQWQGINLGQPFCIYKAAPAGTFDVILAYHTFAVTPQAGHWQSNADHNLFKCFSHNRGDCLFQVRLKAKTLTINQQLEQIKPGESRSDDEGF
jgi:hypothetical protein